MDFLVDAVVGWVRDHPLEAALVLFALVRLFGTTVESGRVGVLFRFGRVVRVAEPGFTWLIPGLETVRSIHSRAITLDASAQRIATADGLVCDASASLVYRVVDPAAAMVEISDVREGCRMAIAIAAFEVLNSRTRESLSDRDALDQALMHGVGRRLRPWGLTVDKASFTNIAASGRTLRLTQLGALARERAGALAALEAGGLRRTSGLFLLGAARAPVSHASARYRDASRRRRAPGPLAMERARSRISPQLAARAEALLPVALDGGWGSSAAETELASMGRAAVPLLRAASLREGPNGRATLARVLEAIESAGRAEEPDR